MSFITIISAKQDNRRGTNPEAAIMTNELMNKYSLNTKLLGLSSRLNLFYFNESMVSEDLFILFYCLNPLFK